VGHAMRVFWLANHTTGCGWNTVAQIIYRDDHDNEMLLVQDGHKRLPQGTQNFKLVPWKAVLEKLGQMQMVDVHVPTNDGRELVMSRYTEPSADQRLLMDRLRLVLPEQPRPKITTQQADLSTDPM
jgi:hypothetical protein